MILTYYNEKRKNDVRKYALTFMTSYLQFGETWGKLGKYELAVCFGFL